jgi:hypothetical protein
MRCALALRTGGSRGWEAITRRSLVTRGWQTLWGSRHPILTWRAARGNKKTKTDAHIGDGGFAREDQCFARPTGRPCAGTILALDGSREGWLSWLLSHGGV